RRSRHAPALGVLLPRGVRALPPPRPAREAPPVDPALPRPRSGLGGDGPPRRRGGGLGAGLAPGPVRGARRALPVDRRHPCPPVEGRGDAPRTRGVTTSVAPAQRRSGAVAQCASAAQCPSAAAPQPCSRTSFGVPPVRARPRAVG